MYKNGEIILIKFYKSH